MREEFVISNFDEFCVPKSELSEKRVKNKWCMVPYETGTYWGKMLCSFDESPEDLELNIDLTGWYKIYVCLLMYEGNTVNIKLSSDDSFFKLASRGKGWGADELEEAFWRCADMTGNKICISRKRLVYGSNSNIAWIRFVPMTEAEVADWKNYFSKPENKRLYATDDIHNKLFREKIQSMKDWNICARQYADSDVGWLSLENIKPITSGACATGDIETSSFGRVNDRNVQEQVGVWYNDKALSNIIETAHSMGIKICSSMRAGAWGMGFPYTQSYFVNDFAEENPQLRCVDRDGQVVDALSYAYPETQDYMISDFVHMAKLGFDAVAPIFHRGIPYVLFEKPVVDRFYELYGEYPYELPLDDERLNQLHCDIMTEFMQRLRNALDEATGKNKTEIHARVMFSVYDSKCVGLDLERWSKEGIVSSIISYPQRIYELLDGDIWKEGSRNRIDLKKYSDYFAHTLNPALMTRCDFKNFIEPYENYCGKICGPKSLKERIQEFMDLERKYGTKIYIEIMPRIMTAEEYKECAVTLYEAGAERLSLWDTYERVTHSSMWSMVRRSGHKEEIKGFTSGENEFHRRIKIIRIAGKYENRYKTYFGG